MCCLERCIFERWKNLKSEPQNRILGSFQISDERSGPCGPLPPSGIPSHIFPEWYKLQGRNLKFWGVKLQSENVFFKSCTRTCRSVDVKLGIRSCPCICDLFIQNQKVEIRGSHPPDCCATSSVLRHVCIVHLLTELGAFVIDISYLDHQWDRRCFVSAIRRN